MLKLIDFRSEIIKDLKYNWGIAGDRNSQKIP
jgi:hypothetical protein